MSGGQEQSEDDDKFDDQEIAPPPLRQIALVRQKRMIQGQRKRKGKIDGTEEIVRAILERDTSLSTVTSAPMTAEENGRMLSHENMLLLCGPMYNLSHNLAFLFSVKGMLNCGSNYVGTDW
jgi:hypothetical protein